MHLAILNTGGTISCVGQPLAPMGAAAFAQACMAQLDLLHRARMAREKEGRHE